MLVKGNTNKQKKCKRLRHFKINVKYTFGAVFNVIQFSYPYIQCLYIFKTYVQFYIKIQIIILKMVCKTLYFYLSFMPTSLAIYKYLCTFRFHFINLLQQ